MKLEMEKSPVAIAEIKTDLIKTNINDIYKAIRDSFKVIKNDCFSDDEDFFNHIYSELKWGTFFKIVNQQNPPKLTLEVYRVHYSGLPVLTKQIVDISTRRFEFALEEKEGDDFIIIGKDTMRNPDAWVDCFISNRVYDPINSDWKKKIITW